MIGKKWFAMVLATAFVGCQTVQQTGRSQFVMVSESQERELGQDAYRQTLKKHPLSTRQEWLPEAMSHYRARSP
jgi:hypothetical protein